MKSFSARPVTTIVSVDFDRYFIAEAAIQNAIITANPSMAEGIKILIEKVSTKIEPSNEIVKG